MTETSAGDSTERADSGTRPASLSRRVLLGVVVAMWSAGSISDAQATRLLYGLQGYGRFGYGGDEEPNEESLPLD